MAGARESSSASCGARPAHGAGLVGNHGPDTRQPQAPGHSTGRDPLRPGHALPHRSAFPERSCAPPDTLKTASPTCWRTTRRSLASFRRPPRPWMTRKSWPAPRYRACGVRRPQSLACPSRSASLLFVIEELYIKHFKRNRPENVRSIEQMVRDYRKKKQERKMRR